MKGFIGTANIDTNSRLCMSSAVAGHTRAFGEDVVPATYDDLDAADLFILVGSNTAWWIVKEVARRMGRKNAFAYDRAADIWREHCHLSNYDNDGAAPLCPAGCGAGRQCRL